MLTEEQIQESMRQGTIYLNFLDGKTVYSLDYNIDDIGVIIKKITFSDGSYVLLEGVSAHEFISRFFEPAKKQ